jgi:hypothetical protein
MTFTDFFFEGWALIGVDALLLACLLVLALLLQPILLGGRNWGLLGGGEPRRDCGWCGTCRLYSWCPKQ